jgi:hypothetical protein
MAILLDANVLLALAWPLHPHHRASTQWFAAKKPQGWATCPLTECGFVRLCSNPKIIPGPAKISSVIASLERITADPRHVFWNDDFQLSDTRFVHRGRLQGHRQITDAYLAGLCLKNNGFLATFDQGITSLLPANEQHRIILLTP